MSYTERVLELRNKALADQRAILARATEEDRDISPEEQEQMERADADYQKYDEQYQRTVRIDKLAAEAAEAGVVPQNRTEPPTRSEPEKPPTETDLFVRALRSFKETGYGEFGARENGDVPVEFRALNVGDDGEGTAFGRGFISDLYVYLREESPMFGAPISILRTNSGNTFDWPKLTADPAHGGTVTAEAAALNELDPTFGQVTFRAHKYGMINLWSSEIDEDNVINLQSVLARSAARELSIDAGAHLTTGTGTTQPNGIVNAAAAGYTATGTASGQSTDTFFSPTDLIQLFGSVVSGHRNKSTSGWMVSTDAATKMRVFKDSTGNFMWEPSLVTGQPDRFYGRPIIENPAMAAVASASNSVIFGDLSAYYTRLVRAPRVLFSREYKYSTDQLALRTIIRLDGNLLDDAAVKKLVSANT